MKKILFIVIILLFPLAVYSQEKDVKNGKWEELFHKANQFYKDGNYESALNTYLEVLNFGYSGGDLYYNMGNTCYRLKMTGHAILYYERARTYIPRDEDLDYNLRYVKKFAKDDIQNRPGVISGIFFWAGHMTRSELFMLFAFVNLFFWASLAFRIYLKKEWTYYFPIILLAVWIIAAASFAWKQYNSKFDKRAVVLAEETAILSGPDERDTVLFRLHSGAIVHQESEEDEWKLISLPDNRKGWVKAGAVEKIKL